MLNLCAFVPGGRSGNVSHITIYGVVGMPISATHAMFVTLSHLGAKFCFPPFELHLFQAVCTTINGPLGYKIPMRRNGE